MRMQTAPVVTNAGGRALNEDFADFRVTDQWGCWVVADGLGGHSEGEHASRSAVGAILGATRRDPPVSQQSLLRRIEEAHDTIRRAQGNGTSGSMRSTVAVLASDFRYAMWAHVGDSRVYHFRGNRVLHQTADHSVPQMLVDSGHLSSQKIRRHADRNRVLRALGQQESLRPTVSAAPEQLQAGDAFLLCTDGWWEYVTETEMEIDLAKSTSADDWLNYMVDRILRRGEGEFDNYTAIGIFVSPDG